MLKRVGRGASASVSQSRPMTSSVWAEAFIPEWLESDSKALPGGSQEEGPGFPAHIFLGRKGWGADLDSSAPSPSPSLCQGWGWSRTWNPEPLFCVHKLNSFWAQFIRPPFARYLLLTLPSEMSIQQIFSVHILSAEP